MSDFLTEQNVIDILLDNAKNGNEISPRVIVFNRVQSTNSITRKVKFALIANSKNLKLVDVMIKGLMDYNNINFVGSELNLQGDLDICYLFYEAQIISNINQI